MFTNVMRGIPAEFIIKHVLIQKVITCANAKVASKKLMKGIALVSKDIFNKINFNLISFNNY